MKWFNMWLDLLLFRQDTSNGTFWKVTGILKYVQCNVNQYLGSIFPEDTAYVSKIHKYDHKKHVVPTTSFLLLFQFDL